MLKKLFAISLCAVSLNTMAVEVPEDKHENDYQWMNLNLYHGQDQRGGPFSFDDQYFEVEFGGRSGALDLYGYVDFKDIFNNDNSDVHNGANIFADIEARFSLDYLFNKDLSVGPVNEWYIATDLYYADNECASGCATFDKDGNPLPETSTAGGLKVFWLGVRTDVNVPWLGKTGVNLYKRFVRENYGASNEGEWDGYAFHVNWYKPFYHFENKSFLSFQGYFDYEFGSDLDKGTAFEQEYRTDSSLQTYLGVWYNMPNHNFKVGYGLKFYDDMTQWKDGTVLDGKPVDTTGVAQYFNVTYAF